MNSKKLFKFANRACQCLLLGAASTLMESTLLAIIAGAILGLIWANNDLKEEDQQ